MSDTEPLKLYFDYKSPYAYLAMQPAFDLPKRYAVDLRWIPTLLRIKGKGQRSVYSEWKVKYSYMDARRWANRRGGFPIMGPRKVYDSTAALIGALYAQKMDVFGPYTERVFTGFFERRIEIDEPAAIRSVLEELGVSGDDFETFRTGEGIPALDALADEAESDHIFGVPIFVFRDELFWGHDRIPLLEERLAEAGLKR